MSTQPLAPSLPVSKPEPNHITVFDKAGNAIDLAQYFQDRVYVFWYKNRFKPASAFVIADSIDHAIEECRDYCDRFSLKFISVHPFFLDLTKEPATTKNAIFSSD